MKEVFVYKESKVPFIIDDYYYNKNSGDKDDKNDLIDGELKSDKTVNTEILIERHKHICDDQKIVEISQNFSKLENVYIHESDKNNEKSQAMKIYELLKKNKDVDAISDYIKEEFVKKEENTILINEIDIIDEKNKNFLYYSNNYFNDD